MYLLQSTVYVKSSSQRDAKKMFEGEHASLEAMEKTGQTHTWIKLELGDI